MIASFFGAVGDVLGAESMYNSAVRFAIVLAFAAVGEWVAERSGTLNISIEAMMIGGAYTAAVTFSSTDNVPLALVAGMIAGIAVAMVQAHLSHQLTVDQFVVGLTLNLFVLGLALFLDSKWEAVTSVEKPTKVPLLSDLPLIGDALFGQPWPMYLIVPLVPIAWWLMFRTRWGLELRSVGDNPQSADVSGIHVNRRRRQAIMFAGLCAGLGGGVLVLGQISISGYESGHVGLKGIIAIAAVIFGGWTLRGTIFGCLVFGYFFALQQTLPVLGYRINAQLAATLPYLVALIVTAAFAARTRQPRALAQPFVRGLT
ncbi:MAG TPA: ABC transporter permease [Ilumatobacteraceae bacterium]|nr:ABC transporter permease [Ilumatobacteraceae bacterium]